MLTYAISYAVIVPHYRVLFIVNPQPNDNVDNVLVITPSTNESPAKVQEYDESIHLTLLDDWHVYKTINMKLITDQGSVAEARLLDGSQLFGDECDHEVAMMIAGYVMEYESGKKNVLDHTVETRVNDKVEVEGEEICVICQMEFEAGEACHALQCGHWYHKDCIDKWVRHGSFCPVCREAFFLL